MTRRIGRGGRSGETHSATPNLREYDVPPASPVTVTRPDGSTVVRQAAKAKASKRPTRRSRARGPLICAWCGQPIVGKPERSTESGSRGKPVHIKGECPREEARRPTKSDPASALPRSRGGTARPYKNPNTRAVPPEQWLKVTCPRCAAPPGTRCTVRTVQGTVKSTVIPHQERPQVVRRAMAAAVRARK